MSLNSDRSRRASATLHRKANRYTSGSWAIYTEDHSDSKRPISWPKENARQEAFTHPSGRSEKPDADSGVNPGHEDRNVSRSQGESQVQSRRTTLRTSQNTTVVHGRERSKSSSHLPSYPESSQPQSWGHLPRTLVEPPVTPTVRRFQVKSKKARDDLRRDAETDFYEQIDAEGVTRRRSMIRNVSKDDHLYARGANPRTGTVTPGVYSASNSFDKIEILHGSIARSARWRQRGDEWVSLEFGQPTPVPTPPGTKEAHQSQGLRTPQRIASGDHNEQMFTQKSSAPTVTTPKAHHQQPAETPSVVPGSYPQTPLATNRVAFHANAASAHSIPRKPVGQSFTNDNANSSREAGYLPRASMVGPDLPDSSHRSSSAPSSSSKAPFTPAYVGKNLPPLPSQDDTRIINNTAVLPFDNPFLDQQGLSQPKNVVTCAPPEPCGQISVDKELPCPPTNSTLFQSFQPLNQGVRKMNQTQMQSVQNQVQGRIPGPREMRPESSYVRAPRPKMAMNMEMQRERPQESRPMPIPFYNNPPGRHFQPTNLRRVLAPGPRMMNRAHHRPNELDDVFGVVPVTTSTSTTMYTSMRSRDHMGRLAHPPPFSDHSEGPHTMRLDMRRGPKPVGMATNMNMSTQSGDLMSVPMIRARPRATSRPQMLGRGEGMNSVPRLNQHNQHPSVNPTTMALPPQWNMTGMPPANRIHTAADVEQDPPQMRIYAHNLPSLHRGGHLSQDQAPANITEHIRAKEYLGATPGQLATGFRTQERDLPQPSHQHTSPRSHTHGQVHLVPEPQQHMTSPVARQSSERTPQAVHISPSGLTRKCSRCHNGFVENRQLSTDGVMPVRHELSTRIRLNVVEEQNCERAPTIKAPVEPGMKSNTCHNPPVGMGPIAKDGMSEPDHRDHTICCPECCKEQDCHEGCLGHPSPSPSPTRSIRSSQDTAGSGNESQSSAKESDAQSNTSEKVRMGRLAFMRSAFKKSFKDRPKIHSRQNSKGGTQSKRNSLAELDTPPIDLFSHSLSPGAFWGGDGSRSSTAAAEAAKAAIGLKKKSSVSSDDAVSALAPLKVKKIRSRRIECPETTRNATAPTPGQTPTDETRRPSPNESRRVASGPSLRMPPPTPSTVPRSASGKSRNASGASVATIEVPMPPFGALGFCAFWEMALVPFEATRMWLRNHPRVLTLAWRVIERGWEMGQIMLVTGSRVWGVVFVYSKTGRLRLKKGDTSGGFVLDCMRSVVYLLVFMAAGVAVMRVVKWVLDVMGILGMVVHGIVWVVKRLLGYGLFW